MNGALAKVGSHPAPSGMYCTFRLGKHLYGIDIADVKEVHRETTFTAVPHTPREVRGYVNLRGQIYLVLDVRLLLGLDAITIGEGTRLVLFKGTVGDNVGILVDRICDIVTLRSEDIEEAGSLSEDEVGSDLVLGVGKLERELVLLMDARKLPRKVEARIGRQEIGEEP